MVERGVTATGGGAAAAAGGGEHARAPDWLRCLELRLKGTEPRHAAGDWIIPGLTHRDSQAHRELFPGNPLPAAVLVPIIKRDPGATILLTRRASRLRNHAGQISFPGGRIEPADRSPQAAALREAREEIGLDERRVRVIGYLPDHILTSGFRVTPVVALVDTGFELRLDATEVEESFEVPLAHLFDPASHQSRKRRIGPGNVELTLWDIPYGEHNIWGATAGMLMSLYRLCISGTLA